MSKECLYEHTMKIWYELKGTTRMNYECKNEDEKKTKETERNERKKEREYAKMVVSESNAMTEQDNKERLKK